MPGNICGLSFIAIPPLLRSNQGKGDTPQTTLARQWNTLYDCGKVQNPPIAAVTGCAFAYLGWAISSHSECYSRLAGAYTGIFYRAAGFLTLGIVPWTVFVMTSTNAKIMTIAEVEAEIGDEEFDVLMRWWQVLNGIRGLFPLAGGILGLATALM